MTQIDVDRYGPGCLAGIGPMSRVYQDERIAAGRVTLGGLITALEGADPASPVATEDGFGLAYPHSYRGYYVDLAFEQDTARLRAGEPEQTVGELLDVARSVVGVAFSGWKAGSFRMNLNTPAWVARKGESGRFVSRVRVEEGRVVIETSEDEG